MVHIRGDTHMTSMKIVQFSRPPPVHLGPKFFHPLILDVQFQMNLPPLQMMTNQLKENIIQGWLLHFCRSFFQSGFRFRYQLINLVCLSSDFFPFSWRFTIYFSVTLYSSCVCSCPKCHKMSFIYNYSHF